MKRFSLIVSLAACLVLFIGANAFAVWDITIESVACSADQTNVEVNVFASWDVPLASFTLPVVVREIDAGSFWTGALPYDTNGNAYSHPYQYNVSWDWGGTLWAALAEEFRPGVPSSPCDTEGDVGYDGISPDHFAINAAGAGGSAPVQQGYAVVTFWFDVTGTPGQFELDMACFTGSLNTIYMVDNLFPPVDHGPAGTGEVTFNKGIITINPNFCPDPIGAYGASVSGTEGDALSMAWDGSTYSDLDGDAARFYLASGPGEVDEITGEWTWDTECCDEGAYTVVINVSDEAHPSLGSCPGELSFSVVVAPYPVGIACPADLNVKWGTTAAGAVTASTICDVDFSGTHVDVDGNFSWTTACQDIGAHTFVMTATDECQRVETCDINVTVYNNVVSCVDLSTNFLFTDGYDEDLNAVYTDPDGDGLSFGNLVVTPTPPDVQMDLTGGVLTWNPSDVDAQFNGGVYEVCVDIFDGCEYVTCCWDLLVQYTQPYKVSIYNPDADLSTIEYEDHIVESLNGRNAVVGLHMKNGFIEGTGAFDFLLCYDCSVLNFLKAEKAEGIADWEYFTYRYGAFGNNCGSGCPSCYIRVIGIRDMNNGVTAPAGSEYVNGFLAYLTFYVTEDRSTLNLCPRIGFCSIDCGDNVISDASGNLLALAFPDQNDPAGFMITFGPDYDLEACLEGFKGENPTTFIYFDPGFICIRPPDDDRGDINLNGIANEVADAVLFTNYFIYGPGEWQGDGYYENRVLASDINDDGIVATVADLVYLIRIITGDAQPFPNSGEYKVNPYASAMDVNTEMVNGQMVVTTNSTSDLGAGFMVFNYTGTIGVPTTESDMTVRYSAENGELRVLVYSMGGNTIDAGVSDFVSIPVDGVLELVESSFSDASGSLMTVDLHRVEPPKAFELSQNYPNPFNASTMIRFAVPTACNWTMNIYNVAGQVVETMNGSAEAGYVSVNWNADVASGIYFYKLQAGDFTATKKMVLMK